MDIDSELCRICLTQKQEDSESLIEYDCIDETRQEDTYISHIGVIYQELFGLMITHDLNHPKYVCSSCALQMRLFQKLKDKAFKSFEQFCSLIETVSCAQSHNEEQQILTNAENLDLKAEYADVLADIEEKGDLNYDETQSVYDNYIDEETLEEISPFKIEKVISDDMEACTETEEECLENEEQDEEENYSIFGDDEIISDLYAETETENIIEDENYIAENENIEDENEITLHNIENKTQLKLQESTTIISCSQCTETFTRKRDLDKHIKKCHPRKTFVCDICMKKVYSKEALKVHFNIHNGLPAYQCDECNKPFNQKIHYEYHMLGHRNERNIICDVCDKAFLSKGDLKIHMRVHNDERRYSCDVCGKSFRAYTHMTNHRFIHFGKKFECSICQQMYSSPNTLRTHVKSVHIGDVTYQCDYCEKRFKRKHHLVSHQKTHRKIIQNFTLNEIDES